ncbi:MAG: hypothetical protein NT166_21835 [Candidatus Aminicenantes bacterium]|nr:hypothetical protein [Candidatus Aminicenantes bacterium]
MLIANPIYDVVFKYLMANLDLAKGVISTIIDEDIVTLDFKAQENVLKFTKGDTKELTYYHLDFVAKIKLKEGGYKNVLIELQKTNVPYDIERFRKYLGAQYQKVDEIPSGTDKSSKESLPIITIYFLGFNLSDTLPSVIKVNRQYIDVLSGKEIHERSEFIERLTHNSFVIQIPGLHVELKTRLELILSVFQQEHFIDKTRHLKSYDYNTTDDLLIKILRQLEKAAGDEELQRQLELEEMALSEYESTFAEFERRIEEKNKKLEQSARELEQKDKYIKELLEKLEKPGIG